jgi:hypothetical protein
MQTIVTIISTSCFAVLIAEASGLMQWIKFKIKVKHLKPLDCPLCLAWWLGIIVFIIEKRYYEAPLFAATSSIIAIFISRTLRS